MRDEPAATTDDPEGRVPIFGTWPRIYTAVVVAALAVMVGVSVFSHWAF